MSAEKADYSSNEHNSWIRGLDFYNQELSILTERLQEIANNNTSDEALQGVENFQDQFMIHQKKIDELQSDIHQFINSLANQLEAKGKVNKECLSEKMRLRETYVTEEKLFNEMRHEFYRFAEEWM